jgi:hypothetical protein
LSSRSERFVGYELAEPNKPGGGFLEVEMSTSNVDYDVIAFGGGAPSK